MPARLIINADDFGHTRGINRAVAELHAAGVLTSATLMANGPAFDDAVAVARANPRLGVGCHIVLTDGTPVSAPETIRTLIGKDGKTFRPSLINFARDLLLGRIASEDIEREALAQIQKLQRAGIDVTHVDTHKHTHIFPAVAAQLANIIRHTSFMAIRNPFEPGASHSHVNFKRRLEIAALNTFQPRYNKTVNAAHTTNGTFGISATGNLNATTLGEILQSIPSEGTYELLCHPGYNDADLDAVTTRLRVHRETEYRALLSEVPKIFSLPNPPELIHYGDLGTALLPGSEPHL